MVFDGFGFINGMRSHDIIAILSIAVMDRSRQMACHFKKSELFPF